MSMSHNHRYKKSISYALLLAAFISLFPAGGYLTARAQESARSSLDSAGSTTTRAQGNPAFIRWQKSRYASGFFTFEAAEELVSIGFNNKRLQDLFLT